MVDISRLLRLLAEGKSIDDLGPYNLGSSTELANTLLDIARKYSPPKRDLFNLPHTKTKSVSSKKKISVDDGIVSVYTDGASSGNPGPSGIGCVVYDKHAHELFRGSKNIGIATNNVAEYEALIFSFDFLKNISNIDKVHFFLDSQLVVRQITGEYKVNDSNMRRYYAEFFEKVRALPMYTINHITRDRNKVADKLASLAKKF